MKIADITETLSAAVPELKSFREVDGKTYEKLTEVQDRVVADIVANGDRMVALDLQQSYLVKFLVPAARIRMYRLWFEFVSPLVFSCVAIAVSVLGALIP